MRARPRGTSLSSPFRGLALVLSLLAASCVESSAPAGPVFPLVPADARLAVVIRNPAAFWNAASAFWKAAGLSDLAGAEPEALLGQFIPDAEQAERYIDPVRPLVLALMPPAEADGEAAVALWVPVRGQSQAWLEKMGEGGSLRYRSTVKAYALFSSGVTVPEFPARATLDLSPLDRYPAGSVALLAGPGLADSLFQDSWAGWERDARSFLGTVTAEDRSLEALAAIGASFLGEIGAAHAALLPAAGGLTIRIGATSRPGSAFERLATAAAASSGSALDMAAHASAEALYAGAWSIDPAASTELLDLTGKLYDSLLAAMPEEESAALAELWKLSLSLQKSWVGIAGARGAYSADLDLDAGALSRLEEAEDLESLRGILEGAIDLRMDYLLDVKDEAKARDFLRSLSRDEKLAAAIRDLAAPAGLGLAIRGEEKREGSFTWEDISLALELLEGDAAEELADQLGELGNGDSHLRKELLESLSSLLSLRWTLAGKRLYMTTQDPAALRALATRKSAPRPLSGEASFLAFRKGIPARPFTVGAFSTRRLASLIAANLPAGTVTEFAGAAGFDPSAFSTWYGYASLDAANPGTVTAGAGTVTGTATAAGSAAGTVTAGAKPAPAPAGIEFGFTIPAGDVAAAISLFSSWKESSQEEGI
jgi:hypothetical protein